MPYFEIEDKELPEKLLKGLRLEKPKLCSDELYDLMLNCWQLNRNNRPSFNEIVDKFSGSQHKTYVDFGVLNQLYVFPPHLEKN